MTGERPVSPRLSAEICKALASRNERLVERQASGYAAVVKSIVEPEAQALLLERVAKEIELRVAVIRQIARNGTKESDDARS